MCSRLTTHNLTHQVTLFVLQGVVVTHSEGSDPAGGAHNGEYDIMTAPVSVQAVAPQSACRSH